MTCCKSRFVLENYVYYQNALKYVVQLAQTSAVMSSDSHRDDRRRLLDYVLNARPWLLRDISTLVSHRSADNYCKLLACVACDTHNCSARTVAVSV